MSTLLASALAFVVGLLLGIYLATDPCHDATDYAKCVVYMNDNP